jgi:peptidoglycan/LPS O-acetylase OafA/YrhL
LKRLPFIPQLDTFRFFSVLIVIFFHWTPALAIFHLPDIGVGFFFALSGYLITSNLLYIKQSIDGGEITVPSAFLRFYYRRFLRIFPLYYLAIFLILLIAPAIFEGNFGWYVSYLPNFLMYHQQRWPDMLVPYWSLGVEEQFYLLWPFLIFLIPWKYLNRLFIGTVIISILFKAVLLHFDGNPFYFILPLSQFDTFAISAMLAYLPFSGRTALLEKKPYNIIAFTGFLVLAAFARHITSLHLLFNLGFSGCAVFIIHHAQKGFGGFIGKILDLPILQYFGRISYGLYVYHNFVPWLWRCLNGTEKTYPLPIAIFKWAWAYNPWIKQIAQVCLLIIIASLSWFLFEKPINNLKNVFSFKKRSSLETGLK